MTTRRGLTRGLLAGAAVLTGGRLAFATDYPTKQVKVVAPFAPGAATDTCARIVAQGLAERWNKPVIVENKIGASGTIAAAMVAQSPPDGHTLLLGTIGTCATNPLVMANVPYDTLNDFTPISLFAMVSMLVVVHPSLPFQSIEELVTYAQKNPGRLNCGNAGIGSSPHLASLLFESLARVKFEQVAYSGVAPMIPDLLANRVNLSVGDASTFLPHVRSGALRALGVTTATQAEADAAGRRHRRQHRARVRSLHPRGVRPLVEADPGERHQAELIGGDFPDIRDNPPAQRPRNARGRVPCQPNVAKTSSIAFN